VVVRDSLVITTNSLPSGATFVPYSTTLVATGGAPYTWAVTDGSLPAGLSLATDGTISGTPTTAGTSTFTVTVTDTFSRTVSKTFGLNVTLTPPLAIAGSTLPNGTVDQGYASQLQATGGVGSRTWSQVGGTLPPGLSLDATGAVTGTPTAIGTYTFKARVQTDTETVDSDVSITIDAPVQITATTLPTVTVGGSLSQLLAATGGDGLFRWSQVSGELPAGITVSAAGLVSGTVSPSATAGTYSFTVLASDGAGGTDTRVFTLKVLSPVAVATRSLPPASSTGTYQVPLAAIGGAGPYTWSVSSPALPPGLHLNPTTGVIAATALTPGTFSFRVHVNDSHGNAATRELTLVATSSALAQSQSCATLPASLPVKGMKLVAKAGCRTSAGQVVTVTARCVWGISRAGDMRMCAVVRDSRGNQSVRTYGYQPVTVQVTLSAPATSGYLAYRVVKTYRIR
jgi:hypothetical protein